MFLLYAVGKDRWPALRREVDPHLERFPVKEFLDDLDAIREVERMSRQILSRHEPISEPCLGTPRTSASPSISISASPRHERPVTSFDSRRLTR